MRMHTRLSASEVVGAMNKCIDEGKIASQVWSDTGFKERRSTKNVRGFEVQLGAETNEPFVSVGVDEFLRQNIGVDLSDQKQIDKRERVIAATGRRMSRNNTSFVLALPYSATWYEWGFFIAALFDLDDSLIFGEYTSRENFIERTRLRSDDINSPHFNPRVRGMDWFAK